MQESDMATHQSATRITRKPGVAVTATRNASFVEEQRGKLYDIVLQLAFVMVIGSIVLKNLQLEQFVPGDITVVGAVLLGVLALNQIQREQYPFSAIFPFVLLVVYLAVHVLIQTETGILAQDQVRKFFLLTVPIVVCIAPLVTSRRNLRLFNFAFFISSVIAVVGTFISGGGTVESTGRFSIGETNSSSTLGYYAAFGLVVCAAHLMRTGVAREHKFLTVIWIAGVPLFTYVMFAAASRGGIVGAATALIFLLLFSPVASKVRLIVFVIVAIPGVAALWNSVSDIARNRVVLQDSGRVYAWNETYQAFLAHPIFGTGFTGVEDAVYPLDYPHNLLLELAATGGFVALLLALWVLGASLRRVWAGRADPEVLLLGALFILLLMGSMVSLDINNRLLWATSIAALVVPFWFFGKNRLRRNSATRSTSARFSRVPEHLRGIARPSSNYKHSGTSRPRP